MNVNIMKTDWDVWFLAITVLVSSRSIDPNTKCGCVIVDKNKNIISLGYNGPIRNSIDSEIPLTRPEKYYHFIHAEQNAILSSSFKNLEGATCYISIRPCHDCLKMLLQCGIKDFIFMDLPNAKCVDEEVVKAQDIMIRHHNVNFKIINKFEIKNLLNNVNIYFDSICV